MCARSRQLLTYGWLRLQKPPPCDYAYGTKRIMRCDHDSSSTWHLLAAGQIYLDISCVSAAI